MREPAVPYLEVLIGVAWWTVGAIVLDSGVGVVVLAAGLGITGGLVTMLRRRYGSGAPLPRRAWSRLLRVLGITAALIVSGNALLKIVARMIPDLAWIGELGVPIACVITGIAFVMLSSQFDERIFIAAGGGMMVLGAAGCLLALDSAGRLYPQGVVGLAAGAMLWLVAAHRTGLVAEVRDRTRR
jgi:hypothetical protein